MKTKIIFISFIILILLFCFFRKTSTLSNAIWINESSEDKYVFAYSNFNYDEYISCGNLKIIPNNKSLDLHILFSNDFLGECFKFENFDIKEFIIFNNLKLVNTEELNNIQIYNCYSNNLPKYKWLNCNKVNIQIAQTNNYIIIGYPLILCGY